MVLATELTPESLIEALETGRFYSSSGVQLSRVESDAKQLTVVVDAQEGETYTIEFIGTRRGYRPEGTPILNAEGAPLPVTHEYDPAIGEVLETVTGAAATYEFQGDEIYVRARVTSSAMHPNPSEIGESQRAWIQPVVRE